MDDDSDDGQATGTRTARESGDGGGGGLVSAYESHGRYDPLFAEGDFDIDMPRMPGLWC